MCLYIACSIQYKYIYIIACILHYKYIYCMHAYAYKYQYMLGGRGPLVPFSTFNLILSAFFQSLFHSPRERRRNG